MQEPLLVEWASYRWRRIPRIFVWCLRPWAVWAVVNGVFRWRASVAFNNPRTFPFYARAWDVDATLPETLARLAQTPTVWLWGSVAAAALVALVGCASVFGRMPAPKPWATLTGLVLLFVLTSAFHVSVSCLPAGLRSSAERSGSLTSGWHAHSTMLYSIPRIQSTEHYLKNFEDIQPRLRHTIHALSHPPAASLSLYWIGNAFGAHGLNIREERTRIRYALGLIVFGALNVFVLYGLGFSVFRSSQGGFAAAALWGVAPYVTQYAAFAQDGVYAVFFNLALLAGWHAVSGSRPVGWAVALGLVLFVLTMMCYSWSIYAAIFAGFGAIEGWRRNWSLREFAVRLICPLTVMTVAAAALLVSYRLDYLAIYRVSRAYVDEWYVFQNACQWWMALIGGQLDIGLMMGSAALSAFVAGMSRGIPRKASPAFHLYVLTVMAVYALPILFGPTALKMETSRCWNWVATLPLLVAVGVMLENPKELPWRTFVLFSGFQSIGMRLFLDFGI